MWRWITLVAAATLFDMSLAAGRAGAQTGALADDIILLSKGQRARERVRTGSLLGGMPGAGDNALGRSPGTFEALLGERLLIAPRPGDVIPSGEPQSGGLYGRGQAPRLPPPAREPARPIPLYGPLELPTEGAGPADGLPLDQLIDHLVRANPDLAAKFQEIPKADADILSAGLRANPLLTFGAESVPYGSYSPQRPGETSYSVTIIQAIDWNQKRLDRVRVAEAAKRVLEAQYQDAVRVEIDNLYTVYVEVLDARELVRAARVSAAGMKDVRKATEDLVRAKQAAEVDLDRVLILTATAETGLDAAEAAYRQAKQRLATLLHLPPEQADALELRGSLKGPRYDLPPPDELARVALSARPDLAAYRLGVRRAEADVRLAQAERHPDVFLIYSPYEFRNNGPTGGQNATSFGVSGLMTLPVFNRNQGNIRRAQINVGQTALQLQSLERQVVGEVRRAAVEAESARTGVARFEKDILPRARTVRDAQLRLFRAGQAGAVEYLNAQREYNDVVRQYLDALVRQRRAELRINTAVGCRLVPGEGAMPGTVADRRAAPVPTSGGNSEKP